MTGRELYEVYRAELSRNLIAVPQFDELDPLDALAWDGLAARLSRQLTIGNQEHS